VTTVSFLLNAYLVGFLADGLLSLADEVLHSAGLEVLSSLRHLVAAPVVLGSAALYGLIGVMTRVPARIVLPPCLFTVWVSLGALPLTFRMTPDDAAFVLALGQIALGLLALLLVHRFTQGARWLFTPESLARVRFSARRAVLFTAGNMLLLPIVGGIYALLWGALTISDLTEGFTWIDTDGIHAEERQYVRGDKRVYLIAMVHFGDRAYFEDVAGSLPTRNAVVLAEGVTDVSGMLAEPPIASDRFVPRAGIVAQGDVAIGAHHDVEAADMDVADLTPATVAFVNAVHEVFQSASLQDALQGYTRYLRGFGAEDISGAIRELIEARNAFLLDRIDQSLEHYDQIIVPWGAAHMPGLEAALEADGFTLLSRKARCVIGWRALPGRS
jgi:hypothetical protein